MHLIIRRSSACEMSQATLGRRTPEQPILAAIDWIVAGSELCSPLWSWTIRTARSLTSRENGSVRFVMGSISQDQEPPGNPGRFKCLIERPVLSFKGRAIRPRALDGGRRSV